MSSQANTKTRTDRRICLNPHRYPTAREFCLVILRVVVSEQSGKHSKRVKNRTFLRCLAPIYPLRTRFSISKRLRDLFPSSSKITLRLDNTSAATRTAIISLAITHLCHPQYILYIQHTPAAMPTSKVLPIYQPSISAYK